MTASPFTRAFLLMFSGPLIWAGHLLAVYVLTALACARHFAHVDWLGTSVTQWGIAGLTLAALAALAVILARQDWRDRNGAGFVGWMTLTLGLLSAISIAWQALPAYVVPTCG